MVRHHQNAHLLETEGRDSKVQEEKEGKNSKEKSITVKNLLLCTLKQRGTRTFCGHLCPWACSHGFLHGAAECC